MKLIKSAKEALSGNKSLIPTNFIDKLEDIVHGFLGILLFVIASLAAFFTLQRLIETRPFFPTGMIQGINDILLVVIILEIMRTVVVRFTDGIFQLDSFLIIGVIAAVRHILTVGAALTMEKDKTTEMFNRSLYEMGVNTGIVLALVFALFLSRSARKNRSREWFNWMRDKAIAREGGADGADGADSRREVGCFSSIWN